MTAGGMADNFGCERCWPGEADAAWDARRELTSVHELIDESHFHVMILECPRCAQRFLSVFTEIIDWMGGDDSQYWTLLPLTEAEACELAQQRESLSESKLHALGHGRRCLMRAWPKGAVAHTLSWTGMSIGPHD